MLMKQFHYSQWYYTLSSTLHVVVRNRQTLFRKSDFLLLVLEWELHVLNPIGMCSYIW